MRWVRTRLRFGVTCALFALAVQFALVFGHTHRGDGAVVLASQAHALVAPTRLQVLSQAPRVPIGPAVPVFHYCEICLLTSLTGSGIPAIPPRLSPPPAAQVPTLRLEADAAPQPYALHPLQARAPPQA